MGLRMSQAELKQAILVLTSVSLAAQVFFLLRTVSVTARVRERVSVGLIVKQQKSVCRSAALIWESLLVSFFLLFFFITFWMFSIRPSDCADS